MCIKLLCTPVKHVLLIFHDTEPFFSQFTVYCPFSSVIPKGNRINNTGKKIIYNVYDYFENESKKRKGSVMKFRKMAEVTGYCK